MLVPIMVGVAALLAILAIVLIPRSGRRDEGPLPVDIETRLLLGERPDSDPDVAPEPSDPDVAPEPSDPAT